MIHLLIVDHRRSKNKLILEKLHISKGFLKNFQICNNLKCKPLEIYLKFQGKTLAAPQKPDTQPFGRLLNGKIPRKLLAHLFWKLKVFYKFIIVQFVMSIKAINFYSK